jgi:hypothetical protein
LHIIIYKRKKIVLLIRMRYKQQTTPPRYNIYIITPNNTAKSNLRGGIASPRVHTRIEKRDVKEVKKERCSS